MKIEEIRSKTDTELEFDLGNLKKELFDLRFRTATDSASNTGMITQLRRSIARILTVRHERATEVRGQGVL